MSKFKVGDLVRFKPAMVQFPPDDVRSRVGFKMTVVNSLSGGRVTTDRDDSHDVYYEDQLELVPGTAEVKPSNPKDSIGVTKPPLSCIPCGPLFEVGAAMLDGSCKYGRHNYREIGVRASVYYDAMLRHAMKWWEGEDRDKDSGCLHLAHLAACALILMDCPDVTDDRPPIVGNPVDRVAELVKAILAKYPEPKAPFVEKK